MKKRDTSNFPTAQAVPPHVAHPLNTQLGNLRGIKVKAKHRFEKWKDNIIRFIWKLADPKYKKRDLNELQENSNLLKSYVFDGVGQVIANKLMP